MSQEKKEIEKSLITMKFCPLNALNDNGVYKAKKYAPKNLEELTRYQSFAETYNAPGVLMVEDDNEHSVICVDAYNYHDGTRPKLLVIFNAEIVFPDDVKYFDIHPELVLQLKLEDSKPKVPIRYSKYRHILWLDELSTVLDNEDALKEISETVKEEEKTIHLFASDRQ